MSRSILVSSVLHLILIIITAMSLPFLAKKPINLPPIVSVELIQITDKTNIPFAPKAKKTIEKIKEKEKKLVSEQAPPKKVKKIKPDAVPMPNDDNKKVKNCQPKCPPPDHLVADLFTERIVEDNLSFSQLEGDDVMLLFTHLLDALEPLTTYYYGVSDNPEDIHISRSDKKSVCTDMLSLPYQVLEIPMTPRPWYRAYRAHR